MKKKYFPSGEPIGQYSRAGEFIGAPKISRRRPDAVFIQADIQIAAAEVVFAPVCRENEEFLVGRNIIVQLDGRGIYAVAEIFGFGNLPFTQRER